MSQLTEKAILHSFEELLNLKPINEITVQNIADKCGINRNTFYYHFSDIPAVLEKLIISQADEIINTYPNIESLEDALMVTISFANKNKKLSLNIYNSKHRDLYEGSLMKMCDHVVRKYLNTALSEYDITDSDNELLIRYYRSLCFGLVIDWIFRGMNEVTADDFRKLLNIRKELSEVINKIPTKLDY